MLDRNRPFGKVSGHQGAACFAQNGKLYDSCGHELNAAGTCQACVEPVVQEPTDLMDALDAFGGACDDLGDALEAAPVPVVATKKHWTTVKSEVLAAGGTWTNVADGEVFLSAKDNPA